jgi:high-affinity iron transporter
MLYAIESGNIEKAQQWRAIIKLPRYASAVAGALALQQLGGDPLQRREVAKLLSKEFLQWQITRSREKTDELIRLVASDRHSPVLVAARVAEIQELVNLPEPLFSLIEKSVPPRPATGVSELLGSQNLASALAAWRLELEAAYPNLLSEEDVAQRERIVLKLLRLIPIEYQSGVRDGEIVIPIEYREAVTFTIQVRRLLAELFPVWRETKPSAMSDSAPSVLSTLDQLEASIAQKEELSEIQRLAAQISETLQKEFGLTLKRAGSGTNAVVEAALEVRSLLGESLAAARAGRWREAEALRLDAYINFDLDIEMRVLPRDPELGLKAERTFLDGEAGLPGIKAALDARLGEPELSAAYQRALNAMDECVALASVGLAPGAAIVNATLIVVREGLEAVVILAALLAGLRGPENSRIRHRIGVGAWLALAASGVLFAVSRTLLSGLSRYGELLEAIISIIAVVLLLMVTNWVFHKYYWTGWNARLRQITRAAITPKSPWLESLALVGLGFMTIFREGFETTLFMQSLILEAGMAPALAGLGIGGVLVGTMGFAVFILGAKLPYRKMLVVTGVLIVFVLFTFVGSTVRIFQTIGWLPIHPIPGFSLPPWSGVWLGLYPSFEGVLIPLLVFAYVGGAWLWVKFSSRAQVQ